jgi:signal transduction histidine kinase
LEKIAPQQVQGKFTLPYVFARAALLTGAVFLILVCVVWYYTATILQREEKLISQVVPELDVAYQLTTATARLQSQSLLLPTAPTLTELRQSRESINGVLQQLQSLLEVPAVQGHQSIEDLRASADQFESLLQALVSNRQQELTARLALSKQLTAIVDDLVIFENDSIERIVELTDRFLSTSVQLSETLDVGVPSDDALVSQQLNSLLDIEYSGLLIQDYELFNQDLLSLQALAERIPLLRSADDLNRAEQLRDLTIRKLLNRAVYLGDDASGLKLMEGINRLRKQLSGTDSLLEKQRQIISSQSRLSELQAQLRPITNKILDRTRSVRSFASESLNLVSEQNTLGLKRYRQVLTLSVAFSVLLLAAVCFWLLYRNLMRPLAQITERLHGVGSEQPDASDHTYLFKEMAELSVAISDLDAALAAMKRKDRQLESNNAELTRVNRDLEQFAHVASHDLQEPLRKLQQFSALLMEDYESVFSDGDGKLYLDVISGSSERMRTLIRDTLEYSRVGLAAQAIDIVDLNAVINSLRQELDILINESEADIRVADLPVVYANQTGMRQLFRNLITNAMKYRREAVRPEILISFRQDNKSNEFVIDVQDNGVGIAPEFTGRVFTPFERLGSAVAGTGLGLAICKKVCESHGWALNLASNKGQGSCFSIHGPLSHLADNTFKIAEDQQRRVG